MPSSELAAGILGTIRPGELLHARCGRPAREHPYGLHLGGSCPFPELPPVEFVLATSEPAVRVCGLPNPADLSPELHAILDDLARRVREEYGLAVEVTADDDLDEVRAALDVIRRRLDP